MSGTAGSMFSDADRELLRESVRGLLGDRWPADAAVADSAEPARVRAIWSDLCAQGLSALCVSPEQGGAQEALAAAQELGRAACPAPLIDAILFNLACAGGTAGEVAKELHAGRAYVCFAFGASDDEPGAGGLTVESGRVSGQLNFIEGASSATHFAVLIDEGRSLAVVAASSGGIAVEPTRALGADGLFQVRFSGAEVTQVPCCRTPVELLAMSRLLHSARALGAADRAFELAVDYVKQRKQFGQPVGRFQAVQHKLANNLIALLGVRLSIENAGAHFDRGSADWKVFGAAAVAVASAHLRIASLETHHAFGAIGYAEEHEAPRHFKQVHLDVLRHGGGRPARYALADTFLGEAACGFPEYDFGAQVNEFRAEVRAWLAEHWTPERRDAYVASDRTHRDFDRSFAKELGETGWLGLAWPEHFGGQGRSPLELLAFIEEMDRAEAPRAGAPIQAQSWMIFGTPEQQARYLPEILRGEVVYGMWYSEPDAGSDLASLRTKAVREGDHWVINGQKIWTTTYWGDYMWLAARTDPEAKPKHAGISMFVVRTDTPGITRTPMRTMYDGEFCNTFFDDVRIPADALVGKENGGWEVLTGSLGTERAFVGSNIILKVAHQFEELCDYLREATVDGKPLRLDPVVRDVMGGFAAQIEVGRQLALNSVRILARGEEPTWEAAIAKVYAGELMERFNEAAIEIIGLRAALSAGSPGAIMRGRIEQKLRHSLMWVISLGTNDIQRTLIAQRALDLPR